MLATCAFSLDGRACRREFTADGHSLCVPHRPCVSSDFVFDPECCPFCSENVKFLRALGKPDRLSQQFGFLKRSWEGVQRSAKRKGVRPSWRDEGLKSFVLGRGGRRASASAASSLSRSSPCPSLPEGPVAGPSSAALAAPPSPVAAPPPSSVAPPPDASPLPQSTPSGLPPQLHDYIRDLVTELTVSRRSSSSGAPSPPPPSPVAPVPSDSSPGPASLPSAAPSAPYGVESSPVSDVAAVGGDTSEHLGELWVRVPDSWQVLHRGDGNILLRPVRSAPGTMEEVHGHLVRWGVSAHSRTPTWHFCPEVPPEPAASSMPCPSWDEVHHSLSALGLLADLSAPVVTGAGEGQPCRALRLSWTDGTADAFLRATRDWWAQSAVRGQNLQPPRPSPRLRAPVVPLGSSLDSTVGSYLHSRLSRAFLPPLATPTAEFLRAGERDRSFALESFSGLSTLLSVEVLLQSLSQLPDVASSISSPALCALFLPLVRHAVWQLAPAAAADVFRALGSHLACWRQAVAPLPPAAQSALLTADPLSPTFGSAQAVTEALARAPQVAVIYRGHRSARPSSTRGGSGRSQHAAPSRPPAVPRRPRSDVRFHPYAPRSASSSSAAGARRSRQPRDSAGSAPRRDARSFRASSSGYRGARR